MALPAAACLALALTFAPNGEAVAADLSAPPVAPVVPAFTPDSGWRVQIAPYGWATSMTGSTTVHGVRANVNESFIDIVKKSDTLAALMGSLELRNDRWSIFGDANWSRVGFSGQRVRQGNPALDISLTRVINADATLTTFIGEAALGYEVYRWAWSPENTTSLDVFGGVRYLNNSVDLNLNLSAGATFSRPGFTVFGARAVAKSGTLQWADPIGGLRIRQQIGPDDELQLRGDLGGFSVGSKFTWQVFAGYGHKFMIRDLPVVAFIGYRALSVDYSQGSGSTRAGMKMVMYGPVLGAMFEF